MADNFLIPTRMLKVETLIAELNDRLSQREVMAHPWRVDLLQPIAIGAPAAAPVFSSTASGSVTQQRDWAYQYVSSETGRQTALSPVLTHNLVTSSIEFTGARSAAPNIDVIQVVTRVKNDAETAWRIAGTMANPASGDWTFSDNSIYRQYMDNDPPMLSRCLLDVACGKGFRLRRVKTISDGVLAPDSSAYWIFGLEVYGDQMPKARKQITQDTTKVGLDDQTVYNVPLFRQLAAAPNADLDWALEENDRVYYYQRGVGAVGPLPRRFAMVDVTREVP